MAGLLVPAVILGQQDAPEPPPPAVFVYTRDTPPPPPPAVLPQLPTQPLPLPGQGADTAVKTVTTPAFPPSPAPPPPPPPVPPAPPPPAPAQEKPPPAQPIATTDLPVFGVEANNHPGPGPIQQVGHVESKPAEQTPAPRAPLSDYGLPMDPPGLAKPEPSSPAQTGPGGEHPPEGVAGSGGSGQGASLVLETTAPPRIVIGKPVQQRIVVRNIGSAAAVGVRVEEVLQPGVSPGRSEPPAAVDGNRLVWDLGSLEAGSERKLQVELQAGEPMMLELSPTLHFLGAQTRVVQPELSLQVEGPERVWRGQEVHFRLVASNNSQRPLYQVRLHYEVPEGLTHPNGKRIGLTLKVLEPGQKLPIDLRVDSVKAGKWVSRVAADGDNGLRAEVQREVEVVEPVLTLSLSGPMRGLTDQEMVFQLEAGNPGPTPVGPARLTLLIPPGIKPTFTQPAALYDAIHRRLSWTVDKLPVDQPQVVRVKVQPQTAGSWPLRAQVYAEGRGTTRAGHTLLVEQAPPLGVEVLPGKEALDIGEETVYEVHVLNLTQQARSNVQLVARLSPTLAGKPVSGHWPGKVEQQQVRFDVVRSLPPSKDATFKILVRGQRPGPGSLQVKVSADGLGSPLVRQVPIAVESRGLRANRAGAAR